MPITTGLSVKGLQQVGTMPAAADRFLNIFLDTPSFPGRLDRVGTVLVCFPLNASKRPVAQAIKLYGHGIAIGDEPSWPSPLLIVSVNWFIPGLHWTCQTPNA